MADIYRHTARSLEGEEVRLSDYEGQVLLIVNTASRCGFTPQYGGLEQLYQRFQPRGFSVLGFPCNQFGKQEPGDAAEIARFCSTTWPVSFPMFAKIDVNGPDAHPLFEQLKSDAPGMLGSRAIKWNFTKFLVNREGQPTERFAPTVKPEDLVTKILKLL
jgi:glutathione peroxidase